jgi:hypothetical protein
MLRASVVAVCVLVSMALAAQQAHAGPNPEPPPQPQGGTLPQPTPSPTATAAQSKSARTSTAASSSGVSNSVPSGQRAVPTTTIVHHSASVPSAATQSHTAPPKTHNAPPKPARPIQAARLFELRIIAGLRELPSNASSEGSGLLLAAGFALVLLVIAETSFLGLASSRFGLGGIRAPSKRRPTDDPLAIRRVRLRR